MLSRGLHRSHLLRTAQKRSLHTTSPVLSRAPGIPIMYKFTNDKTWNPDMEIDFESIPRDAYGVPAHIPPDVSTAIQHHFHVPPQYYPFLKKIADDTPSLKPFMDKLINGQMTYVDYEEMFYTHAKPTRIHRSKMAMPYRSEEEMKKSAEVLWESQWYNFREHVMGEYLSRYHFREFYPALLCGIFITTVWTAQVNQYREDMRLFYLEAPEHKINWVVPRGDVG